MAGIYEIVFHQILAWHHFYDLSTTEIGLLSDGLFHAVELVALVGGFFMLLDLRRNNALSNKRAWAGVFLGSGGFQLFDGIVSPIPGRLFDFTGWIMQSLVSKERRQQIGPNSTWGRLNIAN